jgi:hypothetical protein
LTLGVIYQFIIYYACKLKQQKISFSGFVTALCLFDMNFYQQAASILDRLSQQKGTIKGLTLGDNKIKDKKKMYAIVCETLKCMNRFA